MKKHFNACVSLFSHNTSKGEPFLHRNRKHLGRWLVKDEAPNTAQ